MTAQHPNGPWVRPTSLLDLAPDVRFRVAHRFFACVEPAAPRACWLWKGEHQGKGYGVIHVTGKPFRGSLLAHRVAWELSGLVVPVGLLVLHRCDVRDCVNPRHLFTGTNQDNVADMDAKGRRVSTAHYGEDNGYSKLTNVIVIAMRAMHQRGKSFTQIGREYQVSRQCAAKAIKGETFGHVAERACENWYPGQWIRTEAEAHCRTCAWSRDAHPSVPA